VEIRRRGLIKFDNSYFVIHLRRFFTKINFFYLFLLLYIGVTVSCIVVRYFTFKQFMFTSCIHFWTRKRVLLPFSKPIRILYNRIFGVVDFGRTFRWLILIYRSAITRFRDWTIINTLHWHKPFWNIRFTNVYYKYLYVTLPSR